NHATWYVSEVMSLAAQYSRGGGDGVLSAGVGLFSAGQLRTELRSARSRLSSSRTQLSAALARAGSLARSERRSRRVAASSSLLSDQLGAQKRAFRLGARRSAAEAEVAQLRRELDSARSHLSDVQNEQASGVAFGTGAPQFLANNAFGVGGGAVGS